MLKGVDLHLRKVKNGTETAWNVSFCHLLWPDTKNTMLHCVNKLSIASLQVSERTSGCCASSEHIFPIIRVHANKCDRHFRIYEGSKICREVENEYMYADVPM